MEIHPKKILNEKKESGEGTKAFCILKKPTTSILKPPQKSLQWRNEAQQGFSWCWGTKKALSRRS